MDDFKYLEAVHFLRTFSDFNCRTYQEKFFELCFKHKRVAGLWCRQSGKSRSLAEYIVYRILTEKNFTIVIAAPSRSQSSELFAKMRTSLQNNNLFDKDMVILFNKTELQLTNGNRVLALPCGPEGKTIRGYSPNILIIEESGEMKDDIVSSVLLPMVASTKGQIIKIGTPRSKNHFYRSCYGKNTDYVVLHVDWKMAVNEGVYDKEQLERDAEEMTENQFRCEYDALFLDDADCFFKLELIQSCVMEDLRQVEFLEEI